MNHAGCCMRKSHTREARQKSRTRTVPPGPRGGDFLRRSRYRRVRKRVNSESLASRCQHFVVFSPWVLPIRDGSCAGQTTQHCTSGQTEKTFDPCAAARAALFPRISRVGLFTQRRAVSLHVVVRAERGGSREPCGQFLYPVCTCPSQGREY